MVKRKWRSYHENFEEFAKLAPCFSPQMVYNPKEELGNIPVTGSTNFMARVVDTNMCSVLRLGGVGTASGAILVLPWLQGRSRELRLAPVFLYKGRLVARIGYQNPIRQVDVDEFDAPEFRENELSILNAPFGHMRSYQVEFTRLDGSDFEAQIRARGFEARVASKGPAWRYSELLEELAAHFNHQLYSSDRDQSRPHGWTFMVVPFEGEKGARYAGIQREGSCYVEHVMPIDYRAADGSGFVSMFHRSEFGGTIMDEACADTFAYGELLKGTFELYTGVGWGCLREKTLVVNEDVYGGDGEDLCEECSECDARWRHQAAEAVDDQQYERKHIRERRKKYLASSDQYSGVPRENFIPYESSYYG